MLVFKMGSGTGRTHVRDIAADKEKKAAAAAERQKNFFRSNAVLPRLRHDVKKCGGK